MEIMGVDTLRVLGNGYPAAQLGIPLGRSNFITCVWMIEPPDPWR